MPNRGQFGGYSFMAGGDAVVETGQIVGASFGEIIVADIPRPSEGRALFVPARYLRSVIADPRDCRDALKFMSRRYTKLMEGFTLHGSGFIAHADQVAVDGGVEARCRHRHVFSGVRISDGNGGMDHVAALSIK